MRFIYFAVFIILGLATALTQNAAFIAYLQREEVNVFLSVETRNAIARIIFALETNSNSLSLQIAIDLILASLDANTYYQLYPILYPYSAYMGYPRHFTVGDNDDRNHPREPRPEPDPRHEPEPHGGEPHLELLPGGHKGGK